MYHHSAIVFFCNRNSNIESFYSDTTWFGPYFNKIYLVNLPDTEIGQNRWNRLKKIKWLFPYLHRFPGIYGKRYDFTRELNSGILYPKWDVGTWKSEPRPRFVNMSLGELGCSLSHYNIWKDIVKNQLESSLVIEDDATRYSSDFRENVRDIMKYAPNDWDIVLLGFWLHRGEKGYPINNMFYRVKDFALTHCYAIHQRGAQKLLGLTPIDMPLDSWLSKVSDKLNIYRHNKEVPNRKNPLSRLVRQAGIDKQNVNTNNF